MVCKTVLFSRDQSYQSMHLKIHPVINLKIRRFFNFHVDLDLAVEVLFC